MKTKFKEVAHLYLGCNVQVKEGIARMCEITKASNCSDRIRVKFEWVVKKYYDADGSHRESSSDAHDYYLGHEEIKPILRPLSDMTEEEMKQLYSLVFGKQFCGDNITHRDIGDKKERWVLWSGVERLFIYKDGDIGADSDLHYYTVHQPTIMKWLLSKQFDIFNLIELGEATVLAVEAGAV